MAQTLTPKRVDKVAPGAVRREIPDGGQAGLYLIVQAAPSTAKSWAVRYRYHARPRKMTLGAYPAIDLPQARKLAGAALRRASEGEDPAADKIAARDGATTVKAVWEDYRDLHMTTCRPATAAAAATLFNNDVVPKWGTRGIETIRRRDVMNLLDGMRDEPAKATKAKVRLNHFFGWAVEREIIDASPVANIKMRKLKSRARVLSDSELREIWNAADKVGYPFGPLIRLLMLTMARRTEIASMQWDELNGQENLFTIPEVRAKNGIALDIHRTAAFNAIIADAPRTGDFIFTTRPNRPVSGFAKMKKQLDEITGDRVAPWRLHDIRRTGGTIMQRLGIRKEVIDAAQNHKMAGVSATYLRYGYAAEKVAAFEALAREIDRIVAARPDSSGVALTMVESDALAPV